MEAAWAPRCPCTSLFRNAAFAGARVVWSCRPKLLLLDGATGRELAAAPRSPVMQLGGLPDRLLVGYSNVRPGGIEIDLFEFDGKGVVRMTHQIDTKTK